MVNYFFLFLRHQITRCMDRKESTKESKCPWSKDLSKRSEHELNEYKNKLANTCYINTKYNIFWSYLNTQIFYPMIEFIRSRYDIFQIVHQKVNVSWADPSNLYISEPNHKDLHSTLQYIILFINQFLINFIDLILHIWLSIHHALQISPQFIQYF